jgi:hypothetical protein
LRNGSFQTWHGHLAREKRAVFHEMPQEITGKMPVPRYFATPSKGERKKGNSRMAGENSRRQCKTSDFVSSSNTSLLCSAIRESREFGKSFPLTRPIRLIRG